MDKQPSQTFGNVIWQARRKLGLSQRELAAKVGVDYTYLSKLENDHVEPSEKVIRSLAEHLSLNAEELIYLTGRMTDHDSEALEELVKANYKAMPALFRRVRENPGIDSLVKARDEQITNFQQENSQLRAEISNLQQQLKKYRFYSKEEIENAANDLLRRMQINNFPPKWPFDASRVAEFLGLRIYCAEIPPDEDGPIVAKILPLERKLVINEHIPRNKAFGDAIVAHQIGHWVLHINPDELENLQPEKYLSGKKKNRDCLYCRSVESDLDGYLLNKLRDRTEWQAQYFASCLMLPRHILEEYLRGKKLTRWPQIYAISYELGVTTSNLINRLKDLGGIYIPKGSNQIYSGKLATDRHSQSFDDF
jgi:transcriptional regulator with XRE-family HTH domain